MPNLPTIEPTDATGAAAELLDQVRATLGLVPNMTKVMANSPALLRSYLAMSGSLAGGVLPPAVRERLAITVAEANGCTYCLSAHTYIGEHIAHVDAAELDLARNAESADPHTAALLRLAERIVATRGAAGAAALQAARAAGVTDTEIGEVVAHVALNVLTNYFNVLADVEVDWPTVQPNRVAA